MNVWLAPTEPESDPKYCKMEDSQITLQGGHQELRTENQLLWICISSPERDTVAHDQGTYPRNPDSTPTRYQITAIG